MHAPCRQDSPGVCPCNWQSCGGGPLESAGGIAGCLECADSGSSTPITRLRLGSPVVAACSTQLAGRMAERLPTFFGSIPCPRPTHPRTHLACPLACLLCLPACLCCRSRPTLALATSMSSKLTRRCSPPPTSAYVSGGAERPRHEAASTSTRGTSAGRRRRSLAGWHSLPVSCAACFSWITARACAAALFCSTPCRPRLPACVPQ